MSFLLPPYSPKHIAAFGSLLLLLLVGILLFNGRTGADRVPGNVTKVIRSSPTEVKRQYSEPLKRLEEGHSSVVWAGEGFLILDIRPLEEYDRQHIAGALSAPLDQLQYVELESNTKLVIFSTSAADLDKAVAIFRDKHMEQVQTMQATLDQLEAKGFALTQTPSGA